MELIALILDTAEKVEAVMQEYEEKDGVGKVGMASGGITVESSFDTYMKIMKLLQFGELRFSTFPVSTSISLNTFHSTVFLSLLRHLPATGGGGEWANEVPLSVPLRVPCPKCHCLHAQCCSSPPTGPGGHYPVHLSAPLPELQRVCAL